jgi:protoporphyrin/coproporphyrin ferrochelatase
MTFRPEPAHAHGSAARCAVLLVNLGTPDEPTPAALRRYLAEFLSDSRVVEIPRMLWLPILHGIILRTRPAKSAAKYRSIWMPEGSPLAVWTERQASALSVQLQDRGHSVVTRYAMRYGQPAIAQVMDELRSAGVTRVLVVPLYPQYASATTGSVTDAVHRWAQGARWVPELRTVGAYHDDAGYIDALAARVQASWQPGGPSERLLLSFHGVPERSLRLGDPYHCHCHKTARLLRERLDLPAERVLVTFQSRFGRAKWLEPYTEPTLRALAQQGIGSVDVMCPGFLGDCLETLEEIAQEARDAFIGAGGTSFRYIPCLNDQPQWIDALTRLTESHLQGWNTAEATAAELASQRALAITAGAER